MFFDVKIMQEIDNTKNHPCLLAFLFYFWISQGLLLPSIVTIFIVFHPEIDSDEGNYSGNKCRDAIEQKSKKTWNSHFYFFILQEQIMRWSRQ